MVKFPVTMTSAEQGRPGGQIPAGILETQGLRQTPCWAGRPVTDQITEAVHLLAGDRWVICYICGCPECAPDDDDAEGHEQTAPHSRGRIVSASEAVQWFERQGIDLPEGLRDLAPSELEPAGASPKEPKDRARWLANAMIQVRDHPELSNAKIARMVGIDAAQLSRSPDYQRAADIARGGSASVPRGHVATDPDTRHRDVEAYQDGP